MFGHFDRYLLREALAGMLATSAVLWLVMMANVGVQLFSSIVQGVLPAPVLLGLLWANGVKFLAFVLPISGFLGLLLALGRMYRDQEIPVALACGASPWRLQRPLNILALLWALLVGVLALQTWPATQGTRDTLLQQAMSASVFERLPVGRFLVADHGRVTVYAARLAEDGTTLEDVFVHTRLGDSGDSLPVEGVERAQFARFEEDAEGYRQLVLQNGRRYDGVLGQGDWRVLNFEEHRIDLGLERRDDALAARKRSAMSTPDLWREATPQAWAELSKRIGQPLSALLLGLLALPLARTAPRTGRYARLGAGVLIYVIYFNLITLASKSIEDGRISVLAGIALPHLLILALAVVLFWRQGSLIPTAVSTRAACARPSHAA